MKQSKFCGIQAYVSFRQLKRDVGEQSKKKNEVKMGIQAQAVAEREKKYFSYTRHDQAPSHFNQVEKSQRKQEYDSNYYFS